MTFDLFQPRALARVNLRPYQDIAVGEVKDLVDAGEDSCLVVIPTGGGKTVVASRLIYDWSKSRILFAAHRRELINQTFDKLESMGVPSGSIGVIMGNDRRRNPGAPVQIASIDTLRNRPMPEADKVFIDEAHRCYSPSYIELAAHYKSRGAFVIGLTATPYRANGDGLGRMFNNMIVVVQASQLVRDGFLGDPRTFTVPASQLPKLEGLRTSGADYDEKELAAAVDQEGLVGNIVETWKFRGNSQRTVAFSVNVAHAKHIADAFKDAGIPAAYIDGTMPAHERDGVLKDLERGNVKVVANCGVLTEGWDMPAVKCCILARPTKSKGLHFQQVGRVLRPWQGETPIILDHAGNTIVHGLVTEDQEFTLGDKPKKRKQTRIPAKHCPECFMVVAPAARVCDGCGFEFPFNASERGELETRDGELQEVPKATSVEKKAALEVMKEEALRLGHKLPWVYAQYLDKFGVMVPMSWRSKEEAKKFFTEEDKWAELERLRSIQLENGYGESFVMTRFYQKFSHYPPRDWKSRVGLA